MDLNITGNIEIANLETAPDRLAIISDMTGTLVQQKAQGFPVERQKLLKDLIEKGAFFALVTNDSFSAVEEHFIDHLGSLQAPYYVISGGGYEGYAIEGADFRRLFEGQKIKQSTRDLLVQRIDHVLKKYLDTERPFSTKDFTDLSSKKGARLNLAHLDKRLGKLSFCESIVSKVAVFFLDSKVAGELEQTIFEDIENDKLVLETLASERLRLTRGDNYLDITSCIKSDGIDQLLKLPEVVGLRLCDRNIVALGDSRNDESLLTYKFSTTQKIARVFVGEDTETWNRLNQAYPAEALAITRGYEGAATEYLKKLTGSNS